MIEFINIWNRVYSFSATGITFTAAQQKKEKKKKKKKIEAAHTSEYPNKPVMLKMYSGSELFLA